MPTCPDCGFDYTDEGSCPTCFSFREARRRAGQKLPLWASSPIAATFLRLLAPAILSTALIGCAAWLYATLPVDPTAARSPSAAAPAAGSEASDFAGASATPDGTVLPSRAAARLASASAALSAPRVADAVPTNSKKDYIAWMLSRGDESRDFLEKKWNRAQAILGRKDITSESVLRAFLYTPREYFARPFNVKKAYDNTAIPIGFGQTISGPHMVSHMTQSIEPERGDRILEIGTGSGYQSAVLSELSDHVYTIEIVSALYRETDSIYRKLSTRYPEYASIARKNADGYYGWPQFAPFQKIIVTAGIDHIPPPLLRQLAPNGIMVIPVGPPSGQTVLRIVKRPAPGGGFSFERSDIYRGRKVIFVPFTAKGGARHSLDDSSMGGER